VGEGDRLIVAIAEGAVIKDNLILDNK